MWWDMKIFPSYIWYAVTVAYMVEIGAMEPSESSVILPLKVQDVAAESLGNITLRSNISMTISLTVGTPPQFVAMVVDTGSELSWLSCNKSRGNSPSFDPTQSYTYNPVSCDSSVCRNQTQDLIIPASCDFNNLCHATLTYADFSSSEGNLAFDVFRFASNDSSQLVFGCMDSVYSTNPDDNQTMGLLGMNRGSLSFVSQMSFPEFSYCISSSSLSGVLVLGSSLMPPMNYTPLIENSMPLPYFDRVAYTVQLVGIKVSDVLLPIPSFVFLPDHTGAGQTMIDSGTQFTFLLGQAYNLLRSEFLKQTSGILKPLDDPNYLFQGAMDLCYLVPFGEPDFQAIPPVSLVFDGAEMTVPGDLTLYRAPGEVRYNCSVYCFSFGNSDLLGVEAFIIGHHHQQNMWVNFDLVRSRIGLAQVQCDSQTDILGITM